MTRFEMYTKNVESLAELLDLATNLDLGQEYCKNFDRCNELLLTDEEIPLTECRKCLIKWLSEPAGTERID